MSETKRKGRVTIPTDVDVVPETLEILERWGAVSAFGGKGRGTPRQSQKTRRACGTSGVSC